MQQLHEPPRVCAIVTARGGSKGLPGKNLRHLGGKPLVVRAIDSALGSTRVPRCIVSTDDAEIKAVSLAAGAEVFDRPAELATDEATSASVVEHVLRELESNRQLPDVFVLLQPTSPLRTARHVDACLEVFFRSSANMVIGVCHEEHHPYKSFTINGTELHPLFDARLLNVNRQTLPPVYRQNGAIYAVKSSVFLATKSFFVPPVIPYVMSAVESIDIDSEADILLAEFLLSKQQEG